MHKNHLFILYDVGLLILGIPIGNNYHYYCCFELFLIVIINK